MNIKNFIPNRLKGFVRKYIIPKTEVSKLSLSKREKALKEFYEIKMGEKLNLDNPLLFTEKLQWIKLYYKHPDMKRCVDKYEFKKYVSEKVGEGYTAPLIKVWSQPDEVFIKDLPSKFVLKSNCQSDGNFIILVKNKNEIDVNKVEREIKEKWFDTRLLLTNSFCGAYHGVKPRVIVEEFIEEFEGCANDYKLFCFHGEPKFFYVANDHFKNGENSDNYPITFFTLKWEVMDVIYGKHINNKLVEKPIHIELMIDLAKKLSKDFPFARVDYFDTKEKLYLAELTFYPGGGLTQYYPKSFNKKMGEMLHLTN